MADKDKTKTPEQTPHPTAKKGPGRPKGSKNKEKGEKKTAAQEKETTLLASEATTAPETKTETGPVPEILEAPPPPELALDLIPPTEEKEAFISGEDNPKKSRKITKKEMSTELKKYGLDMSRDAREKIVNAINNDVDNKLLTITMILSLHKKIAGNTRRITIYDVDLAQIITGIVRGKSNTEETLDAVYKMSLSESKSW